MSNERRTWSVTPDLGVDMRPLSDVELSAVVGGFVIYGLGGPDTRVKSVSTPGAIAGAIFAAVQDDAS